MQPLRFATKTITRSAVLVHNPVEDARSSRNLFWLQPRRFSTTFPPPKPGSGTRPPEESKNTALYVGAAAVGLGGLYYYYYMADSRSQSDAERVKQKSQELNEAVKDSAHRKLHQGQDKVDEFKVCRAFDSFYI